MHASENGGWKMEDGNGSFRAILYPLSAVVVFTSFASAQAPPPEPPPPPLVIGRDPAEPGQVIGKQFLLRVWLINVGGPGMQHIHNVRVAADGNIALPGIAPIKAEGTTIAATEAAVGAAYKAASPTASAWITIVDRKPPPPPPPPPAPPPPPPPPAAPAPPPAPPTTKAATSQPVPAPTVTTKPATAPVK
jgi:hypothetical protein